MSITKAWAIKLDQHGGPEVLKWKNVPIEEPAEHEVLIKHHAIGVNFIDTYYRSGLYPTSLPTGLGTEAAGVVEVVGKNVTHLKVGDRVVYAQGPLGAYSEKRIIPAEFVVQIPDEVSFVTAASVLLKGLTVYYLFNDIYALSAGDQFVFHAAAGGLGLIATQWARHLGAQMIGTVSSDIKAQQILRLGAWQAINYTTDNVVERVKQLTHGKLLPVVYDSIGQQTWETSLSCLKPRGLMVSFGNTSGPVTGVNLSVLAQRGSLFVTRPLLKNYIDSYQKLKKASDQVFELVQNGIIQTGEVRQFPLADASQAHEDLLNRGRIGGIVLISG